ncbi:unnamed protein product [Ostreobium quekettii]|uniref:Uncharacterized protein n=1 Tax=Ostreobium quekettii TaxID=121088 RepID=A0A8S1IRC4_9CHLO|nr:unnamed protein product [Ostreobium quekettii]
MVVQNRKKLERLDLESQRQVLEEDILIFSQHRGVKVKIVYDAAGRQTGENEICCEKKSGIDLVFCTTVEADIGLMIEAAQSLLEGAPYVMIATSDRAAQLDCTGPKTRVISSELLLKEIKDCKKRLRAKLLESQTQYARGRLAGAMNSDSDIKKLRDQLLQT